jgi:hypothetical protein
MYVLRRVIVYRTVYHGIYLRRNNTVTKPKGCNSSVDKICAKRHCLMDYVEKGLQV